MWKEGEKDRTTVILSDCGYGWLAVFEKGELEQASSSGTIILLREGYRVPPDGKDKSIEQIVVLDKDLHGVEKYIWK
jgi:hypothetical protein